MGIQGKNNMTIIVLTLVFRNCYYESLYLTPTTPCSFTHQMGTVL